MSRPSPTYAPSPMRPSPMSMSPANPIMPLFNKKQVPGFPYARSPLNPFNEVWPTNGMMTPTMASSNPLMTAATGFDDDLTPFASHSPLMSMLMDDDSDASGFNHHKMMNQLSWQKFMKGGVD